MASYDDEEDKVNEDGEEEQNDDNNDHIDDGDNDVDVVFGLCSCSALVLYSLAGIAALTERASLCTILTCHSLSQALGLCLRMPPSFKARSLAWKRT